MHRFRCCLRQDRWICSSIHQWLKVGTPTMASTTVENNCCFHPTVRPSTRMCREGKLFTIGCDDRRTVVCSSASSKSTQSSEAQHQLSFRYHEALIVLLCFLATAVATKLAVRAPRRLESAISVETRIRRSHESRETGQTQPYQCGVICTQPQFGVGKPQRVLVIVVCSRSSCVLIDGRPGLFCINLWLPQPSLSAR